MLRLCSHSRSRRSMSSRGESRYVGDDGLVPMDVDAAPRRGWRERR